MADRTFPRRTVRTTLPTAPFPPNAARAPIRTRRLVLRPLAQDDLAALHALRTQPEPMHFTQTGRPDRDVAETQAKLDQFLPLACGGGGDSDGGGGGGGGGDARTYNSAVCLAATGELVGLCGMHTAAAQSRWFAWPELGYTLSREHWGCGLASEALEAWLEAWWRLPRSEVEIEVHADSVGKGGGGGGGGGDGEGDKEGGGIGHTVEKIAALVEVGNPASRRVLEKSGFRRFTRWSEPDSRESQAGQMVALEGYCLERPRPWDAGVPREATDTGVQLDAERET